MNGNTETAQRAAAQMLDTDTQQLTKSLTYNGIYETIVEAGYHTEALTDEEASFIAVKIAEEGLNGLEEFANK